MNRRIILLLLPLLFWRYKRPKRDYCSDIFQVPAYRHPDHQSDRSFSV